MSCFAPYRQLTEAEQDAEAYNLLRDTLTETMANPDQWIGTGEELAGLVEYVKWLVSEVDHLAGKMYAASELVTACPPPAEVDGNCPTHPAALWPCALTVAAWHVRNLHPVDMMRRALAPVGEPPAEVESVHSMLTTEEAMAARTPGLVSRCGATTEAGSWLRDRVTCPACLALLAAETESAR